MTCSLWAASHTDGAAQIIQAVKIAALAGQPEVLNGLEAWDATRTITDSDSTPPVQPGQGIPAKL